MAIAFRVRRARARPAATVPDYWSAPVEELTRRLGSSTAGLSSAEAAARLARSGRLALHHHRTELVILLRQFATPITGILIAATVVSAVLGETVDAAIILAIVALSGLLSFYQEFAASRAMEDLLGTVQVMVDVRRDGVDTKVPASAIVPGDVVIVDTGDLIPGDCRVLDADGLLVDEAPLTGESYPAEKEPGTVAPDATVVQRSNCIFRGTHVVRGRAEAIVAAVSDETEFGRVASHLEQRVAPTAFERGISAFGGMLLRVMVVLVAAIFTINLVLGRPMIDSLLFSLAIAVGLTPQLLPAIVSISLSLGARLMARAKVIVKRLSAIEDFGGMDVLCSDKTGTLTIGAVALASATDGAGRESARVRELAYLNALHHSSYENPIDDAILAAGEVDARGATFVAEVPYDFMRKRLGVLVRRGSEGELIVKGAVDNVLAICTSAETDRGVLPMGGAEAALRQEFARLSAEGYRVLAVATKSVDPAGAIGPDDEDGMTFAGFVSFSDPPKPDVRETLAELEQAGISLRIVTGDNRLAAAHVASAVGLPVDRLITGGDLVAMSEEELAARVADTDLFAEIDPVQKERIVRALRSRGHTVGFLGDGINDAPALHAADVGISVELAVDVAKESASIVLLEKDLGVLLQGVRIGRKTFANTLKYVFVTTSANFGNMASMAVATTFLPFLPLLPLQILLLNFLSDLPATTISSDIVDPEQIERPAAWNIHAIREFMVLFGLISSVFDFITFAVLRLGYDAGAAEFRSAWFFESLATELAVMLILRTRRRFFQSRPSALLLGASLLVFALSFVLVVTQAGDPLDFAKLSAPVVLSLLGILAGYAVMTEIGKDIFYRRRSQDSQSHPLDRSNSY